MLVSTTHPYFLSFDAAKEIWPTAVFFRSKKNLHFFFKKHLFFSKRIRETHLFQLLTPAPSWAQPLAGRICHVVPEKQAKHTFTCSPSPPLPFRCKGIAAYPHARPRRVAFGNSPALRVVIPGQALLSVRSSRTLQAS